MSDVMRSATVALALLQILGCDGNDIFAQMTAARRLPDWKHAQEMIEAYRSRSHASRSHGSLRNSLA